MENLGFFYIEFFWGRGAKKTCHMSLTPTATVTDPLPPNSAIIHSKLAHRRQANISDIPFDQKSPGHLEVGVLSQENKQTERHTDMATLWLNWPSGLMHWNFFFLNPGILKLILLSSRKREALNLRTCTDNSTNTKTNRNRQKQTETEKKANKFHMHIMCNVSHITYLMSLVSLH